MGLVLVIQEQAKDYELLHQWQCGQKESGDILVRRYLRPVYRFFRAHGARDVADQVQQTFLSCVRGRLDASPEVPFRLFLLRLAKMQLARSEEVARRGLEEGPLPSRLYGHEDCTPNEEFAQRDVRRRLMRALRRLPLELQTVLVLHYWEGCTVRELASVLNIPPGTVKSRLFRARQSLKASFGEVSGDPSAQMTTLRQIDEWARQVAADPAISKAPNSEHS